MTAKGRPRTRVLQKRHAGHARMRVPEQQPRPNPDRRAPRVSRSGPIGSLVIRALVRAACFGPRVFVGSGCSGVGAIGGETGRRGMPPNVELALCGRARVLIAGRAPSATGPDTHLDQRVLSSVRVWNRTEPDRRHLWVLTIDAKAYSLRSNSSPSNITGSDHDWSDRCDPCDSQCVPSRHGCHRRRRARRGPRYGGPRGDGGAVPVLQ